MVTIIQIDNVSTSFLAGEYDSFADAERELVKQAAHYEPAEGWDGEPSADDVLQRVGESHGGYAKIVNA